MSRLSHLKAILSLPIMVTLVVPAIILILTWASGLPWLILYPLSLLSLISGVPCLVVGLLLVYKTNQLFASVGQGTLSPWDPPKHFVVVGVYRHVRNPMILGVLLVLLGEALLFGSIPLFLWVLFFWVANHVHFIRTEEPALVERFGDEYLRYKAHVPRWIPRLKPWELSTETNNPYSD